MQYTYSMLTQGQGSEGNYDTMEERKKKEGRKKRERKGKKEKKGQEGILLNGNSWNNKCIACWATF